MFRKLLFILLWSCLFSLGASLFSPANASSLQGDPFDIVDTMVKNSQGAFDVQENKLNSINAKSSSISHGGKYKIAGTLDRLRKNIQPYLQWLVFFGLSFATILLIWNGFLLVTNSSLGSWDPKTVKENIKNIVIGVLIMSGFVAILKIVLAVLNMFFG